MKKTNNKGFTIVELIVSFVLVMIVIIYLLKTVVVAVNKNNDLLTLQDFSVYEKNFLSDLYKDIDAVYYSDTFDGMIDKGNNKIELEDIIYESDKATIQFNVSNNSIAYKGKIYKLPDGISFRTVNDKVYNLTAKEDKPYQVLTIYLKIDSTNEDKDMKILYQNMKMEEEQSEEDAIVTFSSNGGEKPNIQWLIYKKDEVLSSRTIKTPKLSKHILVGWNTKADGTGDDINISTKKANDGDIYYAKWESTLKNFTYDFNEANNMNKWKKIKGDRFNISYSNGMNSISMVGDSGFENIYIPFNTVVGKAYTVKFDYINPNGYTALSGYDGIGVQALKAVPNGNNSDNQLNAIYLSPNSNSNTQTLELNFTASSNKTYLTFNFGMATDSQQVNVQLGNIKLIEIVEIGDTISSIPDLELNGYIHSGWFDAKSNGSKVNAPFIVDANKLTIYEKNGVNNYSITYSLDGGTHGASHPNSAYYDQTVTINNPTKSITAKFVRGTNASDAVISSTSDITKSYTFNGWSITDMDNSLHYYGSNTSINTSLSAIKDTTFKNLRGDNGTVSFAAAWSAPTITLPKVTKTGYSCKWKSDTMEWNSEGSYKPQDVDGATSRTFTAVCTANSYTIAFNKNAPSGETISGTMNNLSMTYGTAKNLTANAYTATNFTFLSWNRQANGSGASYSNGQSVNNLATSGTVDLFAQWGRNIYTLQCYKNGGTGAVGDSSAPNPRDCQSGVACAIPKGRYTNGDYYTQDGWATSATGNKVYDINGTYPAVTKSPGDKVNLYAHYQPVDVVIKYSKNYIGSNWDNAKCTSNSSGASFDGSTCRKTIKYGEAAGNLPTPKRSGYTLIGWYTGEYNPDTMAGVAPFIRVKSTTKITEDLTLLFQSGDKYTITLYPHYRKDNQTNTQANHGDYSVVFDKNGGSGTMNKQQISPGVSTKLIANAFTRTGYTFKNWNTKKDGSGTSYSNQQPVTNLADPGDTITLYAQWTAKTYTVTYNGNGGTWNGQSTWSDTATYGEPYYTWPNFFSKTDNTFVGWKGNDGKWWSGGTYWVWDYDYGITITAQWELNSSPASQTTGGDKSCGSKCGSWTSTGYGKIQKGGNSSCSGYDYSAYMNGCPSNKTVFDGTMTYNGTTYCRVIYYGRICN